MGQIVTFYDANHRMLGRYAARGDLDIALFFSDWVTATLRERGLVVQPVISEDNIEAKYHWPSLTPVIESLTQKLREN